MDTSDLSYFIECSRIKSARRKTRLQKEDKEKYIIGLEKKQKILYQQEKDLPWLPLDIPYQKGWKRFFVLRDDVARSRDADFFTELLLKINTTQHANNKSFTKRKKKKRKKIVVDIIQELKSYEDWKWKNIRFCKLNEKERILFKPIKRWCNRRKYFYTEYVFSEPWRFVLKIKPHFITHFKMHDNVLEQQIAELENHIENHHLQHKMAKLTKGRKNHHRCWNQNKLKYLHPFKQKALHTILYECEQEKN